MSTTIKVKHIILTLFLAITGTFFLGYAIGHKKADDASTRLISAFNKEIQGCQSQIEEDDCYICSLERELTTQKALVRSVVLERDQLKRMNVAQKNEMSRIKLRTDTLLHEIAYNKHLISILNSGFKPGKMTTNRSLINLR